MDNFIFIINILEYIIYLYLAASAAYLLVFSFASLFYKEKVVIKKQNEYRRKYAILIPGYKEDKVIVDAVEKNLKLDYPRELFDIYVLADSFSQETIDALSQLDIIVLEMKFENSTKAKSLNSAVNRLGKEYDNVVIFDADNVAEPRFLQYIDGYFDKDYKAVQGHRMAKNDNTKVAALDGISEEINNSIFRKGHVVLGFSSALIGSGMAFDLQVFKRIFPEVSSVGEDKEFDIKLLQNKVRIAYSENAIVYDEKIANIDALENQRSRWIAAQIDMLTKYYIKGTLAFFKGNIDLVVKTQHQILLPRIMMLGVFFGITFLYAVAYFIPEFGKILQLNIFHYLIAFFALCISLFLGIPRNFLTMDLLKTLFLLPKILFTFFKSFIKSKSAKDKFVHTEHGH